MRIRKLLILNGEMSEWLKEHAWKTILAKRSVQHRNAPTRNRFNDFPLLCGSFAQLSLSLPPFDVQGRGRVSRSGGQFALNRQARTWRWNLRAQDDLALEAACFYPAMCVDHFVERDPLGDPGSDGVSGQEAEETL